MVSFGIDMHSTAATLECISDSKVQRNLTPYPIYAQNANESMTQQYREYSLSMDTG